MYNMSKGQICFLTAIIILVASLCFMRCASARAPPTMPVSLKGIIPETREPFTATGGDSILTTSPTGNLVSADPLTNMMYCDASTSSCTQPYPAASVAFGNSTQSWSAGTNSSGQLTFTKSGNTSPTVTVGNNTNTTNENAVHIETSVASATTPVSNSMLYCFNNNNDNTSANSIVTIRTAGSGGGNPMLSMDVRGVAGWNMCVDNRDNCKFKINNDWAGVSSAMTIDRNQYIGVGTDSPVAPLHITRKRQGLPVAFQSNYIDAQQHTQNFDRVNLRFTGGNTIGGWALVCDGGGRIYADSIFCTATAQSSDVRIKKDITLLSAEKTWEIVDNIRPRTYKFIDQVTNTANLQYGLIAQEVEEIIPDAVTYSENYLPNIFRPCDVIDGMLIIDAGVDLKTGIKTKLMGNSQDSYIVVTGKDETDGQWNFECSDKIEDGNYFCYGTEVNDFRSIDYNSILCVTVNAVKDLHEQVNHLQEQFKKQQALLESIANHLNLN